MAIIASFWHRRRAVERPLRTVVGMRVTEAMPATENAPELWTVADVAAYYRRSVRQARRIVATPGFPQPARGDGRRWVPAQVRAWAEGSWEAEASAASPTVLRPGTASGSRIVRRKAA
jgi:hypothetical protein